ncbi:MAG: hypothetical protein AAF699_06855 [Pseudomonadota bacterium]
MSLARKRWSYFSQLRCWLFALGGFCSAYLYAEAPAKATSVNVDAQNADSRFTRTVRYLATGTDEERAIFGSVALTELIALYAAEADLARAEAAQSEGEKQRKLLGWSHAVDQYTTQLLLVLADVEVGFPVEIRIDKRGLATTTVADRPVMLAHPRHEQQLAYEQTVLADFCRQRLCERITVATDPAAVPIPVSDMKVNTLWTFSESGPICSHGGISVSFSSTQNLPILRGLCEALMQELSALVNGLRWQQRHGVEIKWDAITLSEVPGGRQHLIKLNEHGDSALVELPILYDSGALLNDLQAWIMSRTAGLEAVAVQLKAAKYGWE